MSSPVHFLAALTLVGTLQFGEFALAQQACPSGYSCVEYQSETIAIDPAGGPVQYLVWSETSSTVKTLSKETTYVGYEILPLTEQPNGTYVAGELLSEDDEGIFKDSEPGDVFVLTRAE